MYVPYNRQGHLGGERVCGEATRWYGAVQGVVDEGQELGNVHHCTNIRGRKENQVGNTACKLHDPGVVRHLVLVRMCWKLLYRALHVMGS